MGRDPAEDAYEWGQDPPMEWLGEERYYWLEESDEGHWGPAMKCTGLPRDRVPIR